MYRLLLSILLMITTATLAQAQDRPRAILVLDASGSMWGQIDGINKIVIAREVIGDLLPTLPPEQELGLTVYGHRRKGDCTDIETVVAPGLGQLDVIADAVNTIKPRGSTPLSSAVIQAAEALKYNEERATVILVSDGRETCEMDPCEVGRKLEETGVDFTAHVIGFDVSNPADRAQLQCLAEETGGTFRTASNAGELADALLVVAEPPAPPEPEKIVIALNAREGSRTGPMIVKGLTWNVLDPDGQVILQGGDDMTPSLEIVAGVYDVSVTRDVDGATTRSSLTVERPETFSLVLPELPPDPVSVRIHAIDGRNGPRINDTLIWDLTGNGESVLEAEQSAGLKLDLVKGEYVVSVLRPADEATAELRFGVGTVNKTVVVELPEFRPAATLEAPVSAVAGSMVEVRWTGPDGKNDFISVAEPDADQGAWEEYTYTREGTLLLLRMPPEPGEFELRYVLNDGRKALARRAITVTPVQATITPPADLPAGDTVTIDWTGPDYRGDFISVVKPGEEAWINYTYTREGSPMRLRMPGDPGDYELLYVLDQKRTVLQRVPVTVTGVDYSVSVPDSAAAGSEVLVDWTGPDYDNDYIAIVETGADDGTWLQYTYTREGSPLKLQVPLEPGSYEIRYVLSQGRQTKAATPLTVTEVTGSVSGPTSAAVGSTIPVDWQGPGYRNDFVTVATVGSADRDYASYEYTRNGSPAKLQLPVEPGEYELRYIANAAGDRVLLARQPITLTPVTATLDAPDSAEPGSTINVNWEGPGYRNDYLGIGKIGSEGYETYAYTRDGSPLRIRVPDTPGQYELRYFMGQGRTMIATVPLTVQ